MVISCNSFVKFNGKNIWDPQPDCVIPSTCYNQVCYIGTVLIFTLYIFKTGFNKPELNNETIICAMRSHIKT